MKLLFDHNISPRMLGRLVDIFPDATHVALVELERAPDPIVWTYAQVKRLHHRHQGYRFQRPQHPARLSTESRLASNRQLYHQPDRIPTAAASDHNPRIRDRRPSRNSRSSARIGRPVRGGLSTAAISSIMWRHPGASQPTVAAAGGSAVALGARDPPGGRRR